MPTDDQHPDHDDPRADGPDEPVERDPLLPFSIWAKVIPREHTALSLPAVEWLLSRAGGMWGRYGGIRLPMTLASLDDVDPAEPVGVIRALGVAIDRMHRLLLERRAALMDRDPDTLDANERREFEHLRACPEPFLRAGLLSAGLVA